MKLWQRLRDFRFSRRRVWSLVFWDVAPCSHVEVDRRFRGAYCLHHQGGDRDDGLQKTGKLVRMTLSSLSQIILTLLHGVPSHGMKAICRNMQQWAPCARVPGACCFGKWNVLRVVIITCRVPPICTIASRHIRNMLLMHINWLTPCSRDLSGKLRAYSAIQEIRRLSWNSRFIPCSQEPVNSPYPEWNASNPHFQILRP
jgi:hypothetical protein